MLWFNLKLNKCPKCSSELSWDKIDNTVRCNPDCSFLISQARFKEIVDGMNDRRFQPRARELNINDDFHERREKVEDFSDL